MRIIVVISTIIIILIVSISTFAQSSPPTIIEQDYKIMAVFYNTDNYDVIGYAPYNDMLIINDDGVQSDGFNIDGIDWGIITYGLYQYEEIPYKYENIDGYNVVSPWKLYELNLQPIESETLPHSQHIAQLTGVDVNRAKPIEVTRKFHGIEYTENCFVSQSVIAMYLNGQIAIGDYVIVSYISETPNQTDYELPIVVDKVYQSWE